MVSLTPDEKAMLGGEAGPVRAAAMKHLLDVAVFFDAKRLVEVSQAHIMADTEALGEPGVAYLESIARHLPQDRKVVIPTITDPRGTDFKSYQKIRHKLEIVELERRAYDAFVSLGVLMTDTCINYQTVLPPVRGEHLAFGDTGVCIYSNSVFGARTNFEGGPAALSSALTGRAPEYGFHLDENRQPTHRFRVEVPPADLVDWGILGALVGEQMGSYFEVPLIEGIENPPSSDELKHFGAAMASYGSTALFHLADVTPEASEALEGCTLRPRSIDASDVKDFKERFESHDDKLDVVVFAAPQLSLLELRRLAELIEGRRIHDAVTLIAATSPELKFSADRMGITATIESAGGILLEGVCFYQMHARELAQANGWHSLMTNSAKLTNIIAGYGYAPQVASMERCVECAIAGRVL